MIDQLSEQDQRLLRLGPQPYLPHEVIRYSELVEMLKKHDKNEKPA